MLKLLFRDIHKLGYEYLCLRAHVIIIRFIKSFRVLQKKQLPIFKLPFFKIQAQTHYILVIDVVRVGACVLQVISYNISGPDRASVEDCRFLPDDGTEG